MEVQVRTEPIIMRLFRKMHWKWHCGWNLTEWDTLTNTVTKAALVNQQNVVQNEKRESVDNAAYGFNQGLIAKNLYPKGHPYSWTVIGEMEDLASATVEDVRLSIKNSMLRIMQLLLFQAILIRKR